MKRCTQSSEKTGFAAWVRRAATVTAVLAGGLGVALAAFAAPAALPAQVPAAPATATPYSWPTFHAGGAFPDPNGTSDAGGGQVLPYSQLQGTPTGLYPPGSATPTLDQIPSLILGNTGAGAPTTPPGSGGTNGYAGSAGSYSVPSFLNHFFNGPLFQPHYFQIQGPLAFTLPTTGVFPYARVEGSPVVVNATQYPEIGYMFYYGVTVAGQNLIGNGTTESAPATEPSGTPPVVSGTAPNITGTPPSQPTPQNNDVTHAIRQVVYYGRTETLPVILDPTSGKFVVGGVPVPTDTNGNPTIVEGTPVSVGAIYAMDGFTGGIIWRYQTPAFTNTSAGTFNGFSARISGDAHSASTSGPQPFQIGPDAKNSSNTTDDSIGLAGGATFTPGQFGNPTYTSFGTFPASPAGGSHFSLYALTAQSGPNNTVIYTGDWRLFPGSSANDADIVASGTFTATATFDLTTDPTGRFANVVGTFNANAATSGGYAAGFPAQFNGTFDARTGTQVVSGTLATIPGGGTGGSFRNGQVFSSLSVARVNVPVPANYPQSGQGNNGSPNLATKLVVIATDNNGYVYCLDALGNGYRDPFAASNSNVLYQNANAAGVNYTTDRLTAGQVHYDVNLSAATANGPNAYSNINQSYNSFPGDNQWHIGTTFPYWIYRPDASQPLYVTGGTGSTSGNIGKVKATADLSTQSDLPVPQAFNNSSPTLYQIPKAPVDYSQAGSTTIFGSLAPGAGPGTFPATNSQGSPVTGPPLLTRNAIVYAGSSNGVLYALDPTIQSAASAGQGNSFNAPVTGNPGISDDTPMPDTLWWFQAPGADPTATDNTVSITSAPAVLPSDSTNGNDPTVYIGTSNPAGGTDNSGRIYAVDGLVGPRGNSGSTVPVVSGGTFPEVTGPGLANYNVTPRALWSFPDIYGSDNHGTTRSADGKPKAALGNITGSPVVFQNTHDSTLRVYFAANTGSETVTTGTTAQAFPPSDNGGRVWAVNTDGSYGFAYPGATSGSADPNQATLPAMSAPLGGFLRATPAVGFVTYPSSIYFLNASGTPTAWTHTDTGTGGNGTVTFNGTMGATYPMLYIGTNSQSPISLADPSLYYLDLDGATDTEREMSTVVAPNGSSFQSSPILVTNTSAANTTGGNGGSIFITDSANHLLQYQATPITTANTSSPNPAPRLDYTFPFGDAVSTPAVGAADVSQLTGGNQQNVFTGTTTTTENVTDWIYVGDATSGLCFGATPRGFGQDTTGGFLPGLIPPVPPQVNYPPVVSQFPLRAFIFDGTAKHPATTPASLNLDASNPYGQTTSTLPVFEWGQTVYFRIANVVPPSTPLSATDLITAGDNGTVQDPTTPGDYFGGGGPITIQTTEIDQSGQTIPGTVDTFQIPAQITADPTAANGFIQRTDVGTTNTNFGNTSELDSSGKLRAPETTLLAASGRGYVGTSTYNIGFNTALDPQGLTRHNTPGSRRKLINVTQTVTHYHVTGPGTAPTLQMIQLQLVTDPNFSYQAATSGTVASDANTSSLYVDEPTFGILNPIAVRGAGIGLTGGGAHAPWLDTQGVEGVGPFRGVNSTLKPTDMQALANGNSVLTTAPPSGVLATSGGAGTGVLASNAATYQPYYRYVIATTTGQVGHGTTGDNTNIDTTTPGSQVLPVGQKTNDGQDVSGLPANDANYGRYLLDIADRSMLSLAQNPGTVNISMRRSRLAWNDNTGAAGPGARINPLPWDDLPFTGQNNSQDYPDIGASHLTEYLSDTSQPLINPSKQPLTGAAPAGADVTKRQITLRPVVLNVAVPKYQPANLQLWRRNSSAQGPIPPSLNGAQVYNKNDLNFPMGYVAHQRVGASSNPNITPNPRDPNTAYRDVYVYTGVPVDMKLSIQNSNSGNTTDVGVVPHGFGLQTQNFSLAPPAGQPAVPQGVFMPYNPTYHPYFQPLTIYNNGNTNLLNPHLDQKISEQNAPATLPLLSDALDSTLFSPLSYIPAYDDGRTGPRTGLGGAELPYLVRSSLDDDLATAFGINPGVAAQGLTTLYPTVTFHKARVSDGSNPNFPGTIMTVPDVPHDNFYPPYAMPVNTSAAPVLNGSAPAFAAKPYVSVAVPISTPVGNYSQTLRMFEGRDTAYDPLIGPTYAQRSDTFSLALINGVPQALQPYTEPGTTLKVSVEEARLTDGFMPGTLPMFDPSPQGPGATGTKGAADFQPAAFRDPATGNVSLYWTSGRGYAPGSTTAALYNILGANLGYNSAYFSAANNSQWWAPITASTSLPAGNNVGWSVAPDQRYVPSGSSSLNTGDNSAYGFDTNVVGNGANAQYNIVCYAITPATGAITGTGVPVANSTQPKSGVRGLKFTGVSFADPNQGSAITSDLWTFWAGGARGRTALYYSSAASSAVQGYSGGSGPSPFAGAAVLPVPANLVSVSGPAAVLTYAPDPQAGAAGTATPVIEVTYSGTSPTGATSVYVSRYRPYHPKGANGAVNPNVVLLTPMPFRQLTEQLQPDPIANWWQARDAGWVRNTTLDVSVTVNVNNITAYSQSLLLDLTKTVNGAHPLLPGVRVTYDRASGLLTYTGVTLPRYSGGTITGVPNQTVFVDPGSGRVRFGLPLPSVTGNVSSAVTAIFNPMARRITTDRVANTAPSAFLDESYEASASGSGPNVLADRYWFFWQKPAIGDAKTGVAPSLWFKTQRLTVVVTDPNTGLPVTNILPSAVAAVQGNNVPVDVDTTRGRIYFPVTYNGVAMEGQSVTITGTTANGTKINSTATIHWLDEPRYNDPASQNLANDTGPGALEAGASDGYQVPIHTNINESGVDAFLDPVAYNNVVTAYDPTKPTSASNPTLYPHNVWLFWTSTRNGTSDIFYETINPRFAAVTPGSGGP